MHSGLIEYPQSSTSTALVQRSRTENLALQTTRRSFDDDEADTSGSDDGHQYRTYKIPRAQTHPSDFHRSDGSTRHRHRSSRGTESTDAQPKSLLSRLGKGFGTLVDAYTSLVEERAEASTAGSFKDVKTRYLKEKGLRRGEWLSTREKDSRRDCDTATCSHTSRRRIYTLEEKKGKWHDKWSTICRSVSQADDRCDEARGGIEC